MRVLIALDLNDEDLAEAYGPPRTVNGTAATAVDMSDVRESLAGYFGPTDMPIRGNVLSVQDVTRTLSLLLDAAEVGAEGMEEAGVADAHDADEVWETVRNMQREVSEA